MGNPANRVPVGLNGRFRDMRVVIGDAGLAEVPQRMFSTTAAFEIEFVKQQHFFVSSATPDSLSIKFDMKKLAPSINLSIRVS